MMLYKYLSLASGRRIIETSTLGFALAKYFNDPFDQPAYPRETTDGIEAMFDRLRVMGKEHIWAENTGILSLTRTATNPLMWAHYADQHRGVVVGIDAQAAGLTEEWCNLIPAQYGSVIYVSRRPEQPFIGKPQSGLAVGATHHFAHDHYEKLQRLFLHKPLYWAYEEEVRVLKCLKGVAPEGGKTESGSFAGTNGTGPALLCVPSSAIKELYFGQRADHDEIDEFFYRAKELHPHLSVLECALRTDTFTVEPSPYVTIAEASSSSSPP